MLPTSPPGTRGTEDNAKAGRGGEPELSEIFAASCIQFIDRCPDMQSVIHQLVQALCQQGRLDARHADRVIDEFLQRERLMTSALGRGFALPHIRSRLVSEFLGAIGIAPGGIDLASRDGKPTKLVVLIISPWEERERHLGLLSRVVNLTQDKTARLHWESANSLTKTWQHLADLDRRSIDSQGPIRRQAASE